MTRRSVAWDWAAAQALGQVQRLLRLGFIVEPIFVPGVGRGDEFEAVHVWRTWRGVRDSVLVCCPFEAMAYRSLVAFDPARPLHVDGSIWRHRLDLPSVVVDALLRQPSVNAWLEPSVVVSVDDLHVDDGGVCWPCGSAWPCPASGVDECDWEPAVVSLSGWGGLAVRFPRRRTAGSARCRVAGGSAGARAGGVVAMVHPRAVAAAPGLMAGGWR